MADTNRIQTAAADPFLQQPTSFFGRRREPQDLPVYPMEEAADVLRFYRDFAAGAAHDLATMAGFRLQEQRAGGAGATRPGSAASPRRFSLD